MGKYCRVHDLVSQVAALRERHFFINNVKLNILVLSHTNSTVSHSSHKIHHDVLVACL
jgi:hypothetical protein